MHPTKSRSYPDTREIDTAPQCDPEPEITHGMDDNCPLPPLAIFVAHHDEDIGKPRDKRADECMDFQYIQHRPFPSSTGIHDVGGTKPNSIEGDAIGNAADQGMTLQCVDDRVWF